MDDLRDVLETYFDTAPRAATTAEPVGPFTLFVQRDSRGHPFYGRPRLGGTHAFVASDVDTLRRRQREVGVPQSLEWVHETTPTLLDAARAGGLHVAENPLLVLDTLRPATTDAANVRLLGPDDDLDAAVSAVHAGFSDTDDVEPRRALWQADSLRRGLVVLAAAYDGDGGVVGGGAHNPRDGVTELTGIAVLPRARRRGVAAALTGLLADDALRRGCRTVFLSAQDDTVARVYERVGFVRVGTACVAGADR